ncbi:hypothetical protein D3C81_1103360 [compost metagenome]
MIITQARPLGQDQLVVRAGRLLLQQGNGFCFPALRAQLPQMIDQLLALQAF